MTAPPRPEVTAPELARVGVTVDRSQHAVLSGPALELLESCDRAFRVLAAAWGAVEERHPPLIPAAALHRLDYFGSFPHLATFPSCLDEDEANLAAFTDQEPVAEDGVVRLSRLRPVRDVLTPAACYQLYIHHAGERLPAATYLTVRNTCFRRERQHLPLQRQWAFQMREIVVLGDRDETEHFLATTKKQFDQLVDRIGLPLRWENATDPFFRPTSNARYLLQRVAPVKHEALYDGQLAVASTNLHHDHFGATFDLQREGTAGAAAYSGCVAFGLERWVHAIVDHFGPEPEAWPVLERAALQVTSDGPGPGRRDRGSGR